MEGLLHNRSDGYSPFHREGIFDRADEDAEAAEEFVLVLPKLRDFAFALVEADVVTVTRTVPFP